MSVFDGSACVSMSARVYVCTREHVNVSVYKYVSGCVHVCESVY